MSGAPPHVFLAALGASFGEAVHGVRLAADLRDAGQRVIFLGPAGLGVLFDGLPVPFGRIDGVLPRLDQAVIDLLREEGAASLTLCDLAGVFKASQAFGFSFAALCESGLPTLALDPWCLAETGLSWDYGPDTVRMDSEALQVERRLVPVPFVRPTAAGAYNALPAAAPPATAERALVRLDLGLGPGDRLVLWPTARWQHPESQDHPNRRRLAAAVPALLAGYLAAIGPKVYVLHVGPAAIPAGAAALGARYRFAGQVSPAVFRQLLLGADLLLSCNAAATTLGAAVAARLPVLLLTSAVSAATADEAAARGRPGPIAGRWLAQCPGALPLYPLRACPLSLSEFLAPVLHDNPCYDALRQADLLDEEAVLAAARALLFDPVAADEQRALQAAYHARVERLPTGAERFLSLLDLGVTVRAPAGRDRGAAAGS